MKKVRSRSGKAGLPPGSLVRVGDATALAPVIKLFTFTAEGFTEQDLKSLEDVPASSAMNGIAWLDIDGLDDEKVIHAVGERFCLQPLLLEDVLNFDH